VLVVVDQDALGDLEGHLHVAFQVCKALALGAVALERRGLDLGWPTFAAAPSALVDVLDRVVIVEHRACLDVQHALDDLPRDLPLTTLGCNNNRLGTSLLFFDDREELRHGWRRGLWYDLGRLLLQQYSAFEFGVGFLVCVPGEGQGTTGEDDRSDSCGSHEAGSFHRVTKIGDAESVGNGFVRSRY
jgi:hypothetical protein